MPRASRHYIPGYEWHITHRCHKKEYLLKFARDRRRYLRWLFYARKRYCLRVLHYRVTSNHIHILLRDHGDRHVIPRSMQLIAGRTGQEFSQRKGRKGAFWDDRYHATAVETDEHLVCPCDVFFGSKKTGVPQITYPDECWHCNACVEACPTKGAVRLRIPLPMMVLYKEGKKRKEAWK